jgi:hypothetical protein
VSFEICGLRVDIEQEQGPFCNVAWISGFRLHFPTKNPVAMHGQEGAVVP